LSNELLRNVGEFFYGVQWQAPLARELRVSERTMRRWAAGTEEIPRGVWRDLSSSLEIYHRTLGSLMTHVNHAAGLVQVHTFAVYDPKTDRPVQSGGKSTAERISKIGGKMIPFSSEWVPPSAIDAEGRMVQREATQKEQRTAQELADMIAARIGVGGVFVVVHKDPVYGWHPTVMTAPTAAHKCQVLAEEIAAELRTKYDLKVVPPTT
jgi:hypothetical protein